MANAQQALRRFAAICVFCLSLAVVSGCAGRMVCEWQTEDEQLEAIVEKVIEQKKEK